MEEKNVWAGKWKYALVAVCLVAAVSVFAYAKISSGSGKVSDSAAKETASLPIIVDSGQQSESNGASDSSNSDDSATSASSTMTDASGAVTASKNGTKYFTAGCKPINAIKAENLVTFSSPQAAEQAGYTLSKTCQKKTK
jgi:hypothetical protein